MISLLALSSRRADMECESLLSLWLRQLAAAEHISLPALVLSRRQAAALQMPFSPSSCGGGGLGEARLRLRILVAIFMLPALSSRRADMECESLLSLWLRQQAAAEHISLPALVLSRRRVGVLDGTRVRELCSRTESGGKPPHSKCRFRLLHAAAAESPPSTLKS